MGWESGSSTFSFLSPLPPTRSGTRHPLGRPAYRDDVGVQREDELRPQESGTTARPVPACVVLPARLRGRPAIARHPEQLSHAGTWSPGEMGDCIHEAA